MMLTPPTTPPVGPAMPAEVAEEMSETIELIRLEAEADSEATRDVADATIAVSFVDWAEVRAARPARRTVEVRMLMVFVWLI